MRSAPPSDIADVANFTALSKVIVIGSGFSSLSAACYLAAAGHRVDILEKNAMVGGRARRFEQEGFRFDMGPTFYWMPDIFERFFNDFGHSSGDYYRIRRLDPGYEVCFGPGDFVQIPASPDAVRRTFEQIEPGSGRRLERFLRTAGFNYRVAMDEVVYRPGDSMRELITTQTLQRLPQFIFSLRHSVARRFSDPRLRRILEFPVLFLGAKPAGIPSFYRFMNYADMVLGTWHVEGGMYRVVEGIRALSESLGVKIRTGCPVERIVVSGNRTKGVVACGGFEASDAIVSGADYPHTETLLEQSCRNYSDEYWQSRVLAPSALLYYIAFDRRPDRVSHHTLFFDASFEDHAQSIYDCPGWPATPLFYASFPCATDPSLAPPGNEAAVVLVPVAAGLSDTPEVRERYFKHVIRRMEQATGSPVAKSVLFWKSYASSDFTRDCNAYKGNAYGLANILRQTAFLKPKIRNQHLENLFYTGQMTVPGPGVPTALISGKIAARCASRYLTGTKRAGEENVHFNSHCDGPIIP